MLVARNHRNRLYRNRVLFPKDENFIALTPNIANVQATVRPVMKNVALHMFNFTFEMLKNVVQSGVCRKKTTSAR